MKLTVLPLLCLLLGDSYAVDLPKTPQLLDIKSPTSISWRESEGAKSYNVERALESSGPWSVIATEVTNAVYPHQAAFCDLQAKVGHSYYYRVFALDKAGQQSAPSNVVGPVVAKHAVLSDDLTDFEKMYDHHGFQPVSTELVGDDRAKLIPIEGDSGSFLIYNVLGGTIAGIKLFSFVEDPTHAMSLSLSTDGTRYERVLFTWRTFPRTNLRLGRPVNYQVFETTEVKTLAAKFVKIQLHKKAQIGRIEVYYNPQRGVTV